MSDETLIQKRAASCRRNAVQRRNGAGVITPVSGFEWGLVASFEKQPIRTSHTKTRHSACYSSNPKNTISH